MEGVLSGLSQTAFIKMRRKKDFINDGREK